MVDRVFVENAMSFYLAALHTNSLELKYKIERFVAKNLEAVKVTSGWERFTDDPSNRETLTYFNDKIAYLNRPNQQITLTFLC